MYAFSGQLCSGKDHVAENAGLKPVSIAEPMYRIAEHYLGTSEKSIPHVRKFLQVTGMWGRAESSGGECCGVGYKQMCHDMWQAGRQITGMDMAWDDFGRDKDFWLKGTVVRALGEVSRGHRIAVTNGRFENELDMLQQAGFQHFHIMCDETSRRERMGRAFDPAIDMEGTERMAYDYTVRALKDGVKSIPGDGVVWNDSKPSPIPGTLTVAEFTERVTAQSSASHKEPQVLQGRGTAIKSQETPSRRPLQP